MLLVIKRTLTNISCTGFLISQKYHQRFFHMVYADRVYTVHMVYTINMVYTAHMVFTFTWFTLSTWLTLLTCGPGRMRGLTGTHVRELP